MAAVERGESFRILSENNHDSQQRRVFTTDPTHGPVRRCGHRSRVPVCYLALWGEADVAPASSLALLAACSTATIVAMALPWALNRLGTDPAFGSGPLATVVQDLLSLLIYFWIASSIVG